jgi:hypothetical protein
MVAIDLITYIIVFNLNQILRFGEENYPSLKTGMVETMQADNRKMWSQKGEPQTQTKSKCRTAKAI